MKKIFYPFVITVFLAHFSTGLLAADAPTYDRISLNASAQSEVANDLLTAELFVQREGTDAASLAREVNRDIEWAVKQAREVLQVEVRTLDYQTQPVYEKRTLSGWRVKQSIRLKSADNSALSNLIGKLQDRLAVGSIGYALSPEVRKKAEDGLIEQALKAFSERAELVTRRLDRPGYRIVSLDIGTDGMSPRPRYENRAMMMSMDAAPPPTIQSGNQTVKVMIQGEIELRVQ